MIFCRRFLSPQCCAPPSALAFLRFSLFHCSSASSHYFFLSIFPQGNSNFDERMEIFQQLTEKNWQQEKRVDPTPLVGTGNFLKAGRMLAFPFAFGGTREFVFRGLLKIRRISRLHFNKGRRLNEIYFLCGSHLLPRCSFSQNDHFLSTSTTIWPLASAERSHHSLNDTLAVRDCSCTSFINKEHTPASSGLLTDFQYEINAKLISWGGKGL